MKLNWIRAAVAALLVLPAACNWTDSGRFADFRTDRGLFLTQGDPPENTEPISTIHVSRSGWYLFAWIPIVSAELPDAMKLLAEEAGRQGADGVARIKADFRLSSLFTAWSQTAALTGEAYRKR